MEFPNELMLVTPEEDAELTKIMCEEIKTSKSEKLRLPLLFCRERNPSNRGGNSTTKRPETTDFDEFLQTHAFLHKPRKEWTIAQHAKYEELLLLRTQEGITKF